MPKTINVTAKIKQYKNKKKGTNTKNTGLLSYTSYITRTDRLSPQFRFLTEGSAQLSISLIYEKQTETLSIYCKKNGALLAARVRRVKSQNQISKKLMLLRFRFHAQSHAQNNKHEHTIDTKRGVPFASGCVVAFFFFFVFLSLVFF